MWIGDMIRMMGTEQKYINIVHNGNFALDSNSDGLADAFAYLALGNLSVASNIQSFTATVQWAHLRQTVTELVVGHKYLYMVDVNGTAGNIIEQTIGAYASSALTQSGVWQTLSMIVTATNASGEIRVVENRASTWTQIQVRRMALIDLTSKFGAGNEPAKEWCVANITVDKIAW
jgi:hypothetical protein